MSETGKWEDIQAKRSNCIPGNLLVPAGRTTFWNILSHLADFIFLGSKITAGGDCSHEIKGHLLLGRKAMANLDSILKSRDLTSPAKFHIAKAVVFPVVEYRCKSWPIKKAEYQRTDAF